MTRLVRCTGCGNWIDAAQGEACQPCADEALVDACLEQQEQVRRNLSADTETITWVPVAERLPTQHGWYATIVDNTWDRARFDGRGFFSGDIGDWTRVYPSHWAIVKGPSRG